MKGIDARVIKSKDRFRVEPVSDRAKDWLVENVCRNPMGYSFGTVVGPQIQQDMLEDGMTLHVIEVSYH